MSVSAAVRVLPPSRPEPRVRTPAPTVRPGLVERVGRTWGAPVPEELPDAARWSGWLALALAEALLGRRPATQLAGWVSPEVLAGLNRRQRLRPAEDAAPRTVLLSGRVQHPAPRAAEACAVLRSGPRRLVLAFRLEGHGEQWLCTALDAGLAPGARPRTRGTGRSVGASAGESAAG